MNKSNLVRNLFDDLSSKYDLFNDIFSIGLHRVWKKQLLFYLSPSPGERWIDLCCGTGDLAIYLTESVKPSGQVHAIDSAEKTLNLAKKKSSGKTSLLIEWINSDIFEEQNNLEYFDGAVMGFGLRNLSDPFLGLQRIRSFLKKGGRAGVLDFNRNEENSIGDLFQKMYLNNLVIPISSNFGFKEHFDYLEDSIKDFPNGSLQETLAIKAGFSEAKHYVIAFGQMGILILKN
tara:strand:- start:141 stop:836 length:696 start_codon:yes stop_codon:yes gene_type:complete